MNPSRFLCAWLWIALLISPAAAQEGKVVVAKAGSKELKRAAHRMHIPTEQLKNARAALQDATDLARKLDPAPFANYSQLGDTWLQLNRTKAQGVIESLFSQLRASAAKTSVLQEYQQATSAAQQLMFSLGDIDADKAVQLIRQWPDPPASSGEDGSKTRSQLDSQFQSQIAQRLSYRDPAAALKLLPALSPSGAPDYSVRGQLALQLLRMGQQGEALKIADQVIADFQQRAPDARSMQEYANFLQSLSMIDTDRFQGAFSLFPVIFSKQTANLSYPTSIRIGDQTVTVSGLDFAMLNVLRGLNGRPQLAMKTLDNLPDLKAKLDQVGGLDSFLNPGPGRSINYGPAAMIRPPLPGDSGKDPMASLFNELRGKSSKDPGAVKARLEEVASNPEMLGSLVALAQRANWEDPDLCSLALEATNAHLPLVEPLERRAGIFQSLIGTYRMCEGEVDTELLRNGFIIADKLRQEDEKRNPDGVGPKPQYGTQADQLEATLVSEYARDDYDGAMRFLKAKPDDNIKFMTLMRVIQALRVNY